AGVVMHALPGHADAAVDVGQRRRSTGADPAHIALALPAVAQIAGPVDARVVVHALPGHDQARRRGWRTRDADLRQRGAVGAADAAHPLLRRPGAVELGEIDPAVVAD